MKPFNQTNKNRIKLSSHPPSPYRVKALSVECKSKQPLSEIAFVKHFFKTLQSVFAATYQKTYMLLKNNETCFNK